MKLGRTIVAERERIESDSERMQARSKAKRKRIVSVTIASLMLLILVLAAAIAWKELRRSNVVSDRQLVERYAPTVRIMDEDGMTKVSERIKDYVGQLEKDLADLKYKVVKVVMPAGKSRELYIDLAGRQSYFKVSIDRATAVTAEDIDRMARYLDERNLKPEYVDVRVEGKAYYK